MKPCTRCGKRKTKTGVCGNCRFLVKMAASRKSPYKETGMAIAVELGTRVIDKIS